MFDRGMGAAVSDITYMTPRLKPVSPTPRILMSILITNSTIVLPGNKATVSMFHPFGQIIILDCFQ